MGWHRSPLCRNDLWAEIWGRNIKALRWEGTWHVWGKKKKKRKEKNPKVANWAEWVRGDVGEVGRGQIMQHFVAPSEGDGNQTLPGPRLSDTCREHLRKLSMEKNGRTEQEGGGWGELLVTLRMSHSWEWLTVLYYLSLRTSVTCQCSQGKVTSKK